MSTDGLPNLGNLALSRKEDFKAFAEAARRDQPEVLTRPQLNALSEPARADYDRRRRVWHQSLA